VERLEAGRYFSAATVILSAAKDLTPNAVQEILRCAQDDARFTGV